MSELENAVNSVLNDPEQLARIRAMAQSLMGGAQQTEASETPKQEAPDLSSLGNAFKELPGLDFAAFEKLLHGGGVKSRHLAALEALAPCLDDKRRNKLERAIKLARLASLAKLGLGGTEGTHV